MRRSVFAWLSSAALLAALSSAPPVRADTLRLIEHGRVHLSDLTETTPPELGDVDLGPAPPPGASRVFARADVLRELSSQGIDPSGVKLPTLVRVQSKARRFAPLELAELARPRVVAGLPSGVTLVDLKIARGVVASPRIEIGDARIPKLARRAGSTTVTAIIDLMLDGDVAQRLPVTLSLDVSERAAAPLIDKGARVDLVIARGAARISASGIALEAAERGEIASFKVSTTQKVLRARVESSTLALVVTP